MERKFSTETNRKICMTIAGVDPSGGAGVYADIKTFSAFGCFATAVISSITFQNTQKVFGAKHETAESVRKQFEPIADDFSINALKTGMLPTREIIEETAELIKEYDLKNLVVDPVVRSTSGYDLIDDKALRSLIEKLFPIAEIITPNLPEAERIAEMNIETDADIKKAAKIMQEMGAKNVLIKGGHLPSENTEKKAKDYYFTGDDLEILEKDFINTNSTHGTGCTLAAAICANLALGKNLLEAIKISKEFITVAISTSPDIGKGNSPVNHLVEIV